MLRSLLLKLKGPRGRGRRKSSEQIQRNCVFQSHVSLTAVVKVGTRLVKTHSGLNPNMRGDICTRSHF